LRLTAPRAVVPILLEPLIAAFCQAYPEIEVEIAANRELIDIAAEGFDAGIRMGQFIAADMVAVRLSPPFRFIVVAHPDYLARRGAPERPEDLRQHACIRLRRSSGAIALWSLRDRERPIEVVVSGPLIANDFPTILGAALEGIGLGQVPEPIAADHVQAGRQVHVLEPYASMVPGVFLYYPASRQMMPKLRAFIDHVKSRSNRASEPRTRVDDRRTAPRKRG